MSMVAGPPASQIMIRFSAGGVRRAVASGEGQLVEAVAARRSKPLKPKPSIVAAPT
jgi:hypothetical protein